MRVREARRIEVEVAKNAGMTRKDLIVSRAIMPSAGQLMSAQNHQILFKYDVGNIFDIDYIDYVYLNKSTTDLKMKKIATLSTFVFQLLLTYGVLFSIYMTFAILDNDEADLISESALLIIHPIYAIILSTITIGCCFIFGLPIRLISKLNKWWSSKPILVILGILAGTTFLLLSLKSNFADHTTVVVDGENKIKQIPNLAMACTGWFLTAFVLLHFYPIPVINSIKMRWLSRTRH
jgi:hypothetical protein